MNNLAFQHDQQHPALGLLWIDSDRQRIAAALDAAARPGLRFSLAPGPLAPRQTLALLRRAVEAGAVAAERHWPQEPRDAERVVARSLEDFGRLDALALDAPALDAQTVRSLFLAALKPLSRSKRQGGGLFLMLDGTEALREELEALRHKRKRRCRVRTLSPGDGAQLGIMLWEAGD